MLTDASDFRARLWSKPGELRRIIHAYTGRQGYHQIQVQRIDQAIPIVTHPRVINRVGASPRRNMAIKSSRSVVAMPNTQKESQSGETQTQAHVRRT